MRADGDMKPIYKKKEDHRGSSFPYYSALPLIVSYGYRDCDLLMTLSRLSTMNSGTVPNLKQKKRQLAKASTTGFNSQKKEKLAANPTIMWAGKMAAVGFRGAGALRIEWKASRRGGSIRAGSIHSDAKIAKTRNGGRPASRHFRSTWLLSTDRKQSGRKQKISRGWNL